MFSYEELNAVLDQIETNAWVEVYACATCKIIYVDRKDHSDWSACINCDRSFCKSHLVSDTGDPYCLDCLDKAEMTCVHCDKPVTENKYCKKCRYILCENHIALKLGDKHYCETCAKSVKK